MSSKCESNFVISANILLSYGHNNETAKKNVKMLIKTNSTKSSPQNVYIMFSSFLRSPKGVQYK